MEELLAAAAAAGALVEPTPHVTVRSLVWAVHGHVVALAAGGVGARERREFRAFVHRFLDGLYAAGRALDGSPPPGHYPADVGLLGGGRRWTHDPGWR